MREKGRENKEKKKSKEGKEEKGEGEQKKVRETVEGDGSLGICKLLLNFSCSCQS